MRFLENKLKYFQKRTIKTILNTNFKNLLIVSKLFIFLSFIFGKNSIINSKFYQNEN